MTINSSVLTIFTKTPLLLAFSPLTAAATARLRVSAGVSASASSRLGVPPKSPPFAPLAAAPAPPMRYTLPVGDAGGGAASASRRRPGSSWPTPRGQVVAVLEGVLPGRWLRRRRRGRRGARHHRAALLRRDGSRGGWGRVHGCSNRGNGAPPRVFSALSRP